MSFFRYSTKLNVQFALIKTGAKHYEVQAIDFI